MPSPFCISPTVLDAIWMASPPSFPTFPAYAAGVYPKNSCRTHLQSPVIHDSTSRFSGTSTAYIGLGLGISMPERSAPVPESHLDREVESTSLPTAYPPRQNSSLWPVIEALSAFLDETYSLVSFPISARPSSPCSPPRVATSPAPQPRRPRMQRSISIRVSNPSPPAQTSSFWPAIDTLSAFLDETHCLVSPPTSPPPALSPSPPQAATPPPPQPRRPRMRQLTPMSFSMPSPVPAPPERYYSPIPVEPKGGAVYRRQPSLPPSLKTEDGRPRRAMARPYLPYKLAKRSTRLVTILEYEVPELWEFYRFPRPDLSPETPRPGLDFRTAAFYKLPISERYRIVQREKQAKLPWNCTPISTQAYGGIPLTPPLTSAKSKPVIPSYENHYHLQNRYKSGAERKRHLRVTIREVKWVRYEIRDDRQISRQRLINLDWEEFYFKRERKEMRRPRLLGSFSF
ncbi:hypothetical protein C8J57DRAFT_1627941 [Mycena rebaudengoi]|nr:hypothetical protein C8J57DRAFT_1627941 [Mycena rebaudengoi]